MGSEREKTQTGGRKASTGFIPGDYSLAVGMPSTPAPNGWKWTKLSDLARLESGHTPSRKFPEYWDGDVCWIGTRDATANHGQTIYDTNQHASELGIQNSSARMLPTNTVCLSRTASVGYVIVMGKEMATSQDFVNWVCSEELNHQFLKYILLSENRSFLRFASGTTHQTIYFPEVKAFHICHPPLPDQKAIAHILGSLDDKIELNRRMNATLEGMAQALFKSWFVDFDPVIDNALAAGNPIPDELAPRAEVRKNALANRTTQQGSLDHPTLSDPKSLFPAAFEFNDELGWIPEGWRLQSFESLATLDTESVKPFEQPSTVWEHYSIPSYDSTGMPSWDRGDEIKSNKYRVKPGAILSSKLNPETERTWWPFMLDGESAICSTEFMQFVPTNLDEQAFVYSLIRSEPFQANILERVTGSTGSRQRAQPKEIAKIGVLDCGEPLRTEFVKVALPLFQSVRNNSLRNQTLTKLRDTLLPKLISGELRIPEAEKLTEEALT